MENTETTEGSAKPPAGYVECPKKCGRWTINTLDPSQPPSQCWECAGVPALYQKIRPDWTPPVAAPAHVERRKGQRWKSVRAMARDDVLVVTGTLAARLGSDVGWALSDVERSDSIGALYSCFIDSLWSDSRETMTLLTDAPADPSGAGEAGKPSHAFELEMPAGKADFDICDCGQIRRHPVHYPKSPPAQEAPKAALVCVGAFHTCSGPVLARAAGAVRAVMCEAWMLRLEGIIDRATPSTGTPYKGPERINRALARDELVEGDCWPEGSR